MADHEWTFPPIPLATGVFVTDDVGRSHRAAAAELVVLTEEGVRLSVLLRSGPGGSWWAPEETVFIGGPA